MYVHLYVCVYLLLNNIKILFMGQKSLNFNFLTSVLDDKMKTCKMNVKNTIEFIFERPLYCRFHPSRIYGSSEKDQRLILYISHR